MSHFTTLKTQIIDKAYLKKALEDLGYTYLEGNQQINGYAAAILNLKNQEELAGSRGSNCSSIKSRRCCQ